MSKGRLRLYNVALRVTTLAVRFFLVIFLAKFLDPAEVGYYGLFTATVGLLLFFVGLDFYVYTTRELLKLPDHERATPLKAHIFLSLALYLSVMPAVFVVLTYSGWPKFLIWWLLAIVILEHINQEVFRLLIALSRQVQAGILLFARQGSWALAVVVLMAIWPQARSLEVIMGLWAGSGIITVMLGLLFVSQVSLGTWRKPVDWSWMSRGIKISAAFLVATLSLRGMQTSDRYLVEAFVGLEGVAAYVLFIGIAGALLVFLDAGVFAFAYPELIALHHLKDHAAARRRVQQMLYQTLLICTVFAAGSFLILPYLLAWIDDPSYSLSIGLYPWLLLAMILNAVSMVPHYALYARGADRTIIQSHLAALPTFLLGGWILGGVLPSLAVPIALATSFALILVWKTVAYLRDDPQHSPAR